MEAIGPNPDLLKEGTELKIPCWKDNSCVKMIEEKGDYPEKWFGCGVLYRYPWVPFSATLITRSGNIHEECDLSGNKTTRFKKPLKWEFRDSGTDNVLASVVLNQSDELEVLIPDSRDAVLEIDGRICHLK